ncbi:hypothetical protein EAO73_30205, partial [Streptomyces sp. col6]
MAGRPDPAGRGPDQRRPAASGGPPGRLPYRRTGRPGPGARFNDMVASGELAAPLAIGRDHLDCGSVASPYRETEA